MRKIRPRSIMRKRSAWIAGLFTLIVFILGIRLFYVQIIDKMCIRDRVDIPL